VIDRQSVGPVRAVPEPADRQAVWRITRDDGRYRDIEHLDPLRPDAPEDERRSMPSWVVGAVAISAGILAIAIWAVLSQH
jgi:hypothetical protein